MNNEQQNKLLNLIIIVIAIIGIAYVAMQIVTSKRIRMTENPFEYNLEKFNNSEITPTFELTEELELDLQKPAAIAVTAKDELIVAGSIAVHIFDKNTKLLNTFDLSEPATCVTSLHDTIFVGSYASMAAFSTQGSPLFSFSDPQTKTYYASIAANDEFIFTADAGNRIVKKFDYNGNLELLIGAEDKDKGIPKIVIPSANFDLALEGATVWFVNPGMHMLENFTVDGDFRSNWIRTSMRIDGFSGCCNPTHIALLADGSLVTSEKGMVRIKIHDQHGEFRELVAGTAQFPASATGLDLAVDSDENIFVLLPAEKKVRKYTRK